MEAGYDAHGALLDTIYLEFIPDSSASVIIIASAGLAAYSEDLALVGSEEGDVHSSGERTGERKERATGLGHGEHSVAQAYLEIEAKKILREVTVT